MARQRVRSVASPVRHIERQIVQNQQGHLTTQSNDTLYTADDVVILKRVIVDIAFAMSAVTIAFAHSLWVIYILPKDVSAPTFTVTDGELEYDSQVLLPLKFGWSDVADGQSYMVNRDAKYSRKLQPGDRIMLTRLASSDSGTVADASMIQLFFQH